MNIDLELYRVSCEVVKYGSISKAAESNYVSQSALTQSIHKLEEQLGGKVFNRSKSGVALTEEGAHLYEYISNSISIMNNAENIFSKYVTLEKGSIRIGSNTPMFTALLLKPFLSFTKKYPNIHFTLRRGTIDELFNDLSNGKLDLIAWNLPYEYSNNQNIDLIKLKTLNYVFVASKKYLEKHPYKGIQDLDNHNLILPKHNSSEYKILKEFCEKKQIKLHSNYSIPSIDVMRTLVVNDVGVAFTTKNSLKAVMDDVEILETVDSPVIYGGIATLKKNMQSNATTEFIKEIKEQYKK